VNVRLSAVLGAVLGVLGLVSLAVPGVVAALPVNDFLVTGLGALLVLGGVRELQRRRSTERTYAATPDTEQAVELPTPGDEFDRRIEGLTGLRYRANQRNRLREAVLEVAVTTLRRRLDYTDGEARAALREGTWTDDPFAAAFLSGRSLDVGRLARARELLGRGTPFQHRARRAVAELHRIAEGEEGEDGQD